MSCNKSKNEQHLLQLAEGNCLTCVQGRPTKALLAEDFINPINRFVTWLPSAVLFPRLFCVNGAHRRVLDFLDSSHAWAL